MSRKALIFSSTSSTMALPVPFSFPVLHGILTRFQKTLNFIHAHSHNTRAFMRISRLKMCFRMLRIHKFDHCKVSNVRKIFRVAGVFVRLQSFFQACNNVYVSIFCVFFDVPIFKMAHHHSIFTQFIKFFAVFCGQDLFSRFHMTAFASFSLPDNQIGTLPNALGRMPFVFAYPPYDCQLDEITYSISTSRTTLFCKSGNKYNAL